MGQISAFLDTYLPLVAKICNAEYYLFIWQLYSTSWSTLCINIQGIWKSYFFYFSAMKHLINLLFWLTRKLTNSQSHKLTNRQLAFCLIALKKLFRSSQTSRITLSWSVKMICEVKDDPIIPDSNWEPPTSSKYDVLQGLGGSWYTSNPARELRFGKQVNNCI